jgi:hypothetical protein
MTLYCNDCGEGFAAPGDPDMWMMTAGCICPNCLHDNGDCRKRLTPCEACRPHHTDRRSHWNPYCWFCIHKEALTS